jgi:hypothetical protein
LLDVRGGPNVPTVNPEDIDRTHEQDDAKAAALIARLLTTYPDAPQLKYVRRG